MKSLFKGLFPIVLLVALLLLAAVPAFAQGPTTTPAPTGKTAGDPLAFTCDWTYMPPAPAPGYYSSVFYKIGYTHSTELVLYISGVPKVSDPNNFRFDVYDPYDASLISLFGETTVTEWDNWVGVKEGSSTLNKYELGDQSWAGSLNAGKADGYYIVQVINFYPTAVWYNLCSRSYINIR